MGQRCLGCLDWLVFFSTNALRNILPSTFYMNAALLNKLDFDFSFLFLNTFIVPRFIVTREGKSKSGVAVKINCSPSSWRVFRKSTNSKSG